VGFLDRAKKLAEKAKDTAAQAREAAETARDKAQEALQEMRASSGATAGAPPATGSSPPATPAQPEERDPKWGTPYVPGMLGRPGWREKGLTDPAAVLPIAERDRVGVPHTTKSQIIEEPFGMGRRWSSGPRSAALLYQLYPEHQAWSPPGGKEPFGEVGGAAVATLPDGRSLVFLAAGDKSVVLELAGFDDSAKAELARTVAEHIG
jgi:hypothetical protein